MNCEIVWKMDGKVIQNGYNSLVTNLEKVPVGKHILSVEVRDKRTHAPRDDQPSTGGHSVRVINEPGALDGIRGETETPCATARRMRAVGSVPPHDS